MPMQAAGPETGSAKVCPDTDFVMLPLVLKGASLVLDLSGALWWPERAVLVVADLHLEKGSGFAARGVPLPPHDTQATLARLAGVVARLVPRTVVCLGDSFHDRGAVGRMAAAARERLKELVAGRDWVWIAGNHDPAPPDEWGGRVCCELTLGGLTLRHEAATLCKTFDGEVSGHFHPKAALHVRGRRIAGRCFVTDGRRLILPAFGAYAGGLNVLDPAVAGLLDPGFQVILLGRDRLYRLPRERLAPDPLWVAARTTKAGR